MVSEAKRTSLRADKGCSYRCSVGACTRRCVEHEKLPRAESATNAEYTYNMLAVTPLLILFAAFASSAGSCRSGCKRPSLTEKRCREVRASLVQDKGGTRSFSRRERNERRGHQQHAWGDTLC